MILKEKPEDFIVIEHIDLQIEPGIYTYLKITKTNRNTLDIVKFLENKYNTKVGFAGTKDKKAVTTQYFSIKNIAEKQIEECKIDQTQIEILGTGKTPISLGDHDGNEFIITVKNIKNKAKENHQIENYFDEQRFSTNNTEAGRAIIKKDFKKACNTISEEKIKNHLKERPNDYIGALKKLHKKKLSFYIHAYQSYLFNEALKKYVENKTTETTKVSYSQGTLLFANKEIEETELPLPTFDMPPCKEYEEIFVQEEITQRDFLTRSIPDAITATISRPTHIDVDIKIKYENNKAKCQFFLPKGSYATIVIKKLFTEC